MPAKPRSEVFKPDEVGVYHCFNQVAHQRFLFGFDEVTGKNYNERKEWVRDALRRLAAAMAIDILDYGVLDNHLHVVMRNRPDVVAGWSDEQVLRQWWQVCPDRRNADGSVPEPKPCELAKLRADPEGVEKYRQRLSDISWLMRLACQPIAVRANREDGRQGHFFADRFKCNRLETEADVLNCSLYVDLNWVRAGMAETPEESKYTSAYDRIQARWQRMARQLNDSDEETGEPLADDWLSPIFLDEQAEAYVGPPGEADVSPLAEPEGGAVVEVDVSALLEAEAGAQMEVDVSALVEAEAETELAVEFEADVDLAVKSDVAPPLEAEADADTGFDVNADAGVDANVDAGVDAGVDADIDMDVSLDVDVSAPAQPVVGLPVGSTETPDASQRDKASVSASTGCNPLGSARLTNKGFLPITLDQYLSLLDTVGRIIRQDKRGSIPAHLPPILERLGVDPQRWFDSFFDRIGGPPPARPSPATG